MLDFSFLRNFYPSQEVLDFLNQSLFGLGIIDFWLVVHFLMGMVIFLVIRAIFPRGKGAMTLILWILVLFEIFEFQLLLQGLTLSESLLNRILDVAVGMLGAWFISSRSR